MRLSHGIHGATIAFSPYVNRLPRLTVRISINFGEGLKREGEAEVCGGEADVAEERRND